MTLTIEQLALPDVLLIQPRVFGDDRGFFMETWNERVFNDAIGAEVEFVQDNHSRSARKVLRGLHYQLDPPQGKLVRVTAGRIYDVAIDLRRSSESFGRWVASELSSENKHQMWIPAGFGHSFLVLSDSADVLYKATTYYNPSSERSIRWDDPEIGIDWPLDDNDPIVSARDAAAPSLADAEVYS